MRVVAAMLEMRDLARQEERWLVPEMTRTALAADDVDTLEFYRVHLVQLAISSELAAAYIGSDREESPDAAWWAHRTGELISTTVALAPMMLSLPRDRDAE